MELFLKRWLNELRNKPSRAPENALGKEFPDCSGIEWHTVDDRFEARFIQDGKEMIAVYSAQGRLLEHRTNLPRDPLPHSIASLKGKWGEVMSLISITRSQTLNYEIVFRKPDHTRYLVVTDEDGNLTAGPKELVTEEYPDIDMI